MPKNHPEGYPPTPADLTQDQIEEYRWRLMRDARNAERTALLNEPNSNKHYAKWFIEAAEDPEMIALYFEAEQMFAGLESASGNHTQLIN